MVENPNGSNLLQQDLEKIHEDDLEVMDFEVTSFSSAKYEGKKDNKKRDWVRFEVMVIRLFPVLDVEQEGKRGNHRPECRAPRNKEGQFKNQDNTRKQGNNEDTSSKAMLAIDGVGLKREVACKDYEINMLKSEFEKVKQEKEGIEFKIEKFDNGSKSLNKLLDNPEFKSYGFERRTHPNAQRNMVPRAVLMKTGLKPFNTARIVKGWWMRQVVHKELGDRMERAVTTASSLEAEQDSEDADGISSLPNSEIFEQLALMGCLLFKERMNKGNGWWRNWLFNMKEHFNIMRRQEHLPERV
ncbi:hypothetical protein Tco_1576971 [Tanacetum coccineum]